MKLEGKVGLRQTRSKDILYRHARSGSLAAGELIKNRPDDQRRSGESFYSAIPFLGWCLHLFAVFVAEAHEFEIVALASAPAALGTLGIEVDIVPIELIAAVFQLSSALGTVSWTLFMIVAAAHLLPPFTFDNTMLAAIVLEMRPAVTCVLPPACSAPASPFFQLPYSSMPAVGSLRRIRIDLNCEAARRRSCLPVEVLSRGALCYDHQRYSRQRD